MKKKIFVPILTLTLTGILVFSGCQIYKIISEYESGERTYDDLEIYVSTPSITSTPQNSSESEEKTENAWPEVDFEGLAAINPDIVGWIYPLLLELGNLSLNFEELKSKQELISYLMEHGPNHSSLMDFCEEYRDRYGNELCWSYPISDGKHLGTFIVLVKEGILSLPYDDADKDAYELFCMEDITFFDSDSISYFIDDWHLFDQDLLQAMYAIKHYLQKQEEQNEKQY